MGVATSDGTAGTRAALQSLKIDRYLPHVFGYDSVARPKPAPDMVFAFAAAIGAEPEAIAVIGDNTHDLEMARSAGAGAALGVLERDGHAGSACPARRPGARQRVRPAGLAQIAERMKAGVSRVRRPCRSAARAWRPGRRPGRAARAG